MAGPEDLDRARLVIAKSDLTVCNAALTGDKRLLFNDSGDSFVMYQIAGRSWIALGDPVGRTPAAEELVWRFPRDVRPGMAARPSSTRPAATACPCTSTSGWPHSRSAKKPRVPLAEFSLEGSARADLRQAHRRAERDGATFEVLAPEQVIELIPVLEKISNSWLASKSTGEKRFSVGAFSAGYLCNFPHGAGAQRGAIQPRSRTCGPRAPRTSCQWT